jgi:hypothetical protein
MPSINSGSAYRGSNPWGAAKSFQSLTDLDFPKSLKNGSVVPKSRTKSLVYTLKPGRSSGNSTSVGSLLLPR